MSFCGCKDKYPFIYRNATSILSISLTSPAHRAIHAKKFFSGDIPTRTNRVEGASSTISKYSSLKSGIMLIRSATKILYLMNLVVRDHCCGRDEGPVYFAGPLTVLRQKPAVTAAHGQAVMFADNRAGDDFGLRVFTPGQFPDNCKLLKILLPEESTGGPV
jgi:hypothetical protein